MLSKEEQLKQISKIQANGTKLVVNGVIVYTLGDNQVTFDARLKVFTLTYNHEVYTS